MTIKEKSFPRGGLAPKEQQGEKPKQDIVFGAVQKKLKKSKPKKDVLEEDEENNVIETVSAELLNYETIQEGMLILGVIKSINNLHLRISLPGRISAQVHALQISDAYTKVAREFVEQADSANNYKPLKELYTVGQLVYGRVQELKQITRQNVEVNISLKPTVVHTDLLHSNIKKGFIFNGAVEEIQEHGYIIETGIKGLRCFLPKEKAKTSPSVGELIFLKVEKITSDKAASTCICKQLKADALNIKNQLEANLDYLLPGTIVQFNVTKKLKDGLQGTIMNDAFTAYINEHQLQKPLALPEDYDLNSKLKARILYVMPLTKLVYLTLNLQRTQGVEEEEDGEESAVHVEFKRGDIIDNARVHHVGTGGVVLVLNKKFKGIISYRSIKANYKGNYDQDEMLSKYAKKTKLTVRVLDYDLMDSMYICTDDAKVITEKVFTLDDIKPGDFVTAVVKGVYEKVEGYDLQIGRMKGIIEKLFLSPTSKHLEIDSKIRCRIVAINAQYKNLYLTNRPEYMIKGCKVLTSLEGAEKNKVYSGTVVSHNKNNILVKFFNNIKGVLHRQQLNTFLPNEIDNFYVGQTMQFRITARKDEQISLGLVDSVFKMGEICPATVVNNLDSGLEIKIEYDEEANETSVMKGLVPLRLLSDFNDLLLAQLNTHPPNTDLQICCVNKNIFSLRDVEYFLQNCTNTWGSVKIGDILKATIKNVTENIIEIMLPISNFTKLVRLHRDMLLINVFNNPNIMLTEEQTLYVKVLSKEENTKSITVSGKLTDVWDGLVNSTSEYIEKYLDERESIRNAYKKLKHPIAKYVLGDIVSASFVGVFEETNEWHYELVDTKLKAVVPASMVNRNVPEKGKKQDCVVLWVDYSSELVWISNKQADLKHISRNSELPTNLVGQSDINAKVLLKLENVLICSLKKGNQPLIICPSRLHYNDFENCGSINVKEQSFCKLNFIRNTKPIAVLESTYKLFQTKSCKKRINTECNEAPSNKKSKKNNDKDEVATVEKTKETKKKKLIEKSEKVAAKKSKTDSGNMIRLVNNAKQDTEVPKKVSILNADKELKNKTTEKSGKKENVKKASNLELKKETETSLKKRDVSSEILIEDNALFFVDQTPDDRYVKKLEKNSKPKEKLSLPGIDNFWNTDLSKININDKTVSSDEEDEPATDIPQKKKKLTATEKFKQERDEEARLRIIEEKYANPDQIPETVDQFDRLVMSDPNNAKHWISYMVFHLQETEIDKARAVAQRAIKAIPFRNLNERLNIWMALLNLELHYGTKETYDNTMKEALTCNDPMQIHLRSLEILKDPNNRQELFEIISTITKKYKMEVEAWRAVATAYFNIGMAERAQQMLQKSLLSLPEREHVNTIVMFANLNHKYNKNEIAQTLLEQVVTSYPKRVDVWTQYVDMLVKDNLIDSARGILERAVMQKIPLKKMRTLFKKYLSFEEQYGTEENQKRVKNLATEYVKNSTIL